MAQPLEMAMLRRLAALFEPIIGGRLSEKVLLYLLAKCYQSRFNLQWYRGTKKPHFEEQRLFFFDFIFSTPPRFPGISPFLRGFWDWEVIRDCDEVLDIGCGDGFFSMRFLADRASHVDAIDVDPEALRIARLQNRARNVEYHSLDAVSAPFPRSSYDVIVMDGSLGHFSPKATETLLTKICGCLGNDGVFVGSESLGPEGHDHLQEFESLDDLASLLQPCFAHIYLRELRYPLSWAGGFVRKEAFWRCANDPHRLGAVSWRPASESEQG